MQMRVESGRGEGYKTKSAVTRDRELFRDFARPFRAVTSGTVSRLIRQTNTHGYSARNCSKLGFPPDGSYSKLYFSKHDASILPGKIIPTYIVCSTAMKYMSQQRKYILLAMKGTIDVLCDSSKLRLLDCKILYITKEIRVSIIFSSKV